MKAYILTSPGPAENLQLIDLPVPTPAAGEVLIKVKAISLNPVDVKTREGKGTYGRIKDQTPLILGWDISGVVDAIGSGVSKFKKGDEVFGMINFPGHGKAYAEYVVAPENHLAIKPTNITPSEAAAASLAALTAWQALVTNAKVSKGQHVLIHGAAGGVGHYAVQIAKFLGAYVIGTSSAAKKDFVLSLGADEHFDYTEHKFEETYHDLDMVLDTVGGDNMLRSIGMVKRGGKLISIPSGLSPDIEEKSKEKGINGKFMLVA